MSRSVLVAGAGVLGAALAQRLAARGLEVTLVDRFGAGDPRAASSGSTRLLRVAHGEDVEAAASACEAAGRWRDLQAVVGRELLVETGTAYFAPAPGVPGSWLEGSCRVLGELGVALRVLERGEARGVFPSLSLGEDEAVAFEPGAGVLRAGPAVRSLVDHALAHGCRVLTGRAVPCEGGALVDGEPLRADRSVWACGAWHGELFPDLVDVQAIEQDLFFFAVASGWASPGVPAWMDVAAEVSGTADVDGLGVKVGADCPGPVRDLDHLPASHDVAQEALARSYLRRRFPALAAAPLARAETCHSVVVRRNALAPVASPGGIGIAAHPSWPGVWILGDGSGHGFKHAPSIARLVDDLLAQS